MRELMQNAWQGWLDFTDGGKLAALFLAALIFLWMRRRETGNGGSSLRLYATVMAVCCICPLTAAVLMKYQTRFYDYQWIWSMVPMTLTIAWAGTLLCSQTADRWDGGPGSGRKCAGLAAVMIAVFYLCGSLQGEVWDAGQEAEKRQKTERVLEVLTQDGQNTDIMLWAPGEIMEYARALDGHVRLPYGRNMWDKALNAYSYDVYGTAETTLYEWMCSAEETGAAEAVVAVEPESAGSGGDALQEAEREDSGQSSKERVITVQDCLEQAQGLGVNRILLPGSMQPEALAEWEERLGLAPEQVEGYYLFRL